MRDMSIKDPLPGQTFTGNGKKRKVVRRYGYNVYYVSGKYADDPICAVIRDEKCCFITTWKEWCRKNKVTVENESN
jgi:uncharacterized protein with PIN domain